MASDDTHGTHDTGNPIKDKLAAGEPVFGISLMEFQSSGWPTVFAQCGFDFLFVDMEHSTRSIDRIGSMIWTCLHSGIDPVVRVPSPQRFFISRVLDAGARTLIVPRVEEPDQVDRIVRYALYPPEGDRSLAGSGRNFGLQPQSDLRRATRESNHRILIGIQIETRRGVDNIESLLGRPGVGMVFVGPSDLSLTMGIPGRFDHPDFTAALKTIAEATRRHGHVLGMQSMNVEFSKRMMTMGLRFVCCGSGIGLIRRYGAQVALELRENAP